MAQEWQNSCAMVGKVIAMAEENARNPEQKKLELERALAKLRAATDELEEKMIGKKCQICLVRYCKHQPAPLPTQMKSPHGLPFCPTCLTRYCIHRAP